MRPPTPEEKKKFHRSDAKLIGFDQKDGWKGELPFYKFKCKEHGEQSNYPQGFAEVLYCPICDNDYFKPKEQKNCGCNPYLANCSVST